MTRTELIAALEAAEGPSRELDYDIEDHLPEWENLGGWWRRHKVTGRRERYDYQPAPYYTLSLDAAVALVERVLPDAEIHLRKNKDSARAALFLQHAPFSVSAEIMKPMLAIALCIALLKAMEGK